MVSSGHPKVEAEIRLRHIRSLCDTPQRRWRHIVAALALAGCGSCVPLDPSMHDVTGRWQVQCEGGTETLELKADGRYSYTIESPRRRVKAEGAWTIEPARERIAGARIILRNSPPSCANANAFPELSKTGDSSLAPVWEWGHTELSFNPDIGGFRRLDASQ
jgi:hypothetical protein